MKQKTEISKYDEKQKIDIYHEEIKRKINMKER